MRAHTHSQLIIIAALFQIMTWRNPHLCPPEGSGGTRGKIGPHNPGHIFRAGLSSSSHHHKVSHLLPVLFPPHLNSNYVPEWLFRSPLNRWPLANGCKFCLIQSWLWIERESSTFFCHVGHGLRKTLIIHKLSRLWRQPTLIVGSPACN